jgi:hypothetical protein
VCHNADCSGAFYAHELMLRGKLMQDWCLIQEMADDLLVSNGSCHFESRHPAVRFALLVGSTFNEDLQTFQQNFISVITR